MGGSETLLELSFCVLILPVVFIFNCHNYYALGKLERLDLSGHIWNYEPDHASLHAEFVRNGKPVLILPLLSALVEPYDDDP